MLAENKEEPKLFLKLYPNPAAAGTKIKVQPEPLLVEGKISIRSIMGQLIYEQPVLNNVEAVIEIELPASARGMFIIMVERANSTVAQRVLLN